MSAAARSLWESAAAFGRRTNSDLDVNSLLSQLVDVISEQLQVEFSSFLELLPDGEVLFRAGLGWTAGVVGNTTFKMSGNSPAGHVIRTLAPLSIHNLSSGCGYEFSPLLQQHRIVSLLIVPVLGTQRPLGVLASVRRCKPSTNRSDVLHRKMSRCSS